MIDARIGSQRIIAGLGCPKCGHAVPVVEMVNDSVEGFDLVMTCCSCHADILKVEIDVSCHHEGDDEDGE